MAVRLARESLKMFRTEKSWLYTYSRACFIAASSAAKIPESRGSSQDLATLSDGITNAHEESLSRREPSVKILMEFWSESSPKSSEKTERARVGFNDASFLLSGNLVNRDTGLSHGGEQDGKVEDRLLLNKFKLRIERSGLQTGMMAGVLRG